jgi:hypothetical protein
MVNLAACANGAIMITLPDTKLTASDFLIDMSYPLTSLLAHSLLPRPLFTNRSPNPMRIFRVMTRDYENRTTA